MDQASSPQAICRSIFGKILLLLHPGLCIAEVIFTGESLAIQALRTIDPDSGLAFPLSISVGSTIGDYSPSDIITSTILPANKLIRIKIGLYIRKEIYHMGTTVSLSEKEGSFDEQVFPQLVGTPASCLTAAYVAYRLVVKQLKAGSPLSLVRDILESVTKHFRVHLLEGVASYCLADNGLDHTLEVFQNSADQPLVRGAFREGSVFVIDIITTDSENTTPNPIQDQAHIYLPPPISLAPGEKIFAKGRTGALQKELQQMRRFPLARRHISQQNKRQFDQYKSEMQPFVLTRLPGKANIAQILATIRIGLSDSEILATPILPNIVKAPIQPTEEMLRLLQSK